MHADMYHRHRHRHLCVYPVTIEIVEAFATVGPCDGHGELTSLLSADLVRYRSVSRDHNFPTYPATCSGIYCVLRSRHLPSQLSSLFLRRAAARSFFVFCLFCARVVSVLFVVFKLLRECLSHVYGVGMSHAAP